MRKLILYYLPLITLLFSWEILLAKTNLFWYWFILTLASGIALSFWLDKGAKKYQSLIDRLAFVILIASIFWWLLWLDFGFFNYFAPIVFWLAVIYFLRYTKNDERETLSLPSRLALFLGGIFFSSSISFGVITVLGYPLWLGLIIFLLIIALPMWSSVTYLQQLGGSFEKNYVFLMLLIAELFSVIVWLPFTEITLGLILTIITLAAYDLLKYFAQPELIVRKIIVKKLLVYIVFLLLLLVSTPWQ